MHEKLTGIQVIIQMSTIQIIHSIGFGEPKKRRECFFFLSQQAFIICNVMSHGYGLDINKDPSADQSTVLGCLNYSLCC